MTSTKLDPFNTMLGVSMKSPESISNSNENQNEIIENLDSPTAKDSDTSNSSISIDFNNKVACSSCRGKKLKCDKLLPTCSRCKTRNLECVYVEHKKTGPKPSGKPRARSRSTKKRQHNQATNNLPEFSELGELFSNSEKHPLPYEHSQNSSLVSQKKAKLTSNDLPLADSSNQVQGNSNPEVHNTARLRTAKSIREREKILGLKEVGLTLDDVDKLQNVWFQYSHKICKYSKKRYLYYFEREPLKLLHFSHMLWAAACLTVPGYESKATVLYEKSLKLGDKYWEGIKNLELLDDFNAMYYLHFLSIRIDFEFITGRELKSALTLCCAVRLTQMFGYDQLDISEDKLLKPTVFMKNAAAGLTKDSDEDNLDEDISLIEEKRHVFWGIYASDKWYSLITGLPSSVTVDSHTVIFTKLPSPTTFLSLNNSSEVNEGNELNEENAGFYLHEAMHKLDDNQVLIDLNSSSSRLLLLTISENIIKWCKIFLNMVELESLNSQEGLVTINEKVEELVKNFDNLQSNLLLFDMNSEPFSKVVVGNTTTVLYHSVLIKFSSLFEKKLSEDPTGSTITSGQREYFIKILLEVSNLSLGVAKGFLETGDISNLLSSTGLYILLVNDLKSLLQSSAFFKIFGNLLNLDVNVENSINEQIHKANKLLEEVQAQTPASKKMLKFLSMWIEKLNNRPESLSFFDAFA